MIRNSRAWLALIVLVFAAACDRQKSENPLSPSVAGPVAGVTITAPKPIEPSIGADLTDDRTIALIVENATTTGQRPLTYTFEIATDITFANRVFFREGVTPGSNGRTSVQTTDPMPPGKTYFWRARANDGANTGEWGSAHFQVYTPVNIGIPVALFPAGDTVLDTPRPRFRVRNVQRSGPTGQFAYTFEISTSDSFVNSIAVVTVPEGNAETELVLGQDLAWEQRYFWRVRAYDGSNGSQWSAVQMFRTSNPVRIGAPVAIFPAPGVTVDSRRPRFVVRNVPRSGPLGQFFYTFEVARDAGFSSKVAVVTVPEGSNETQFTIADELEYGRTYFWRARGYESRYSSDWTNVQSFRGPNAPPPPPPPPAPSPGPSPGPSPAPGGPCNFSSPFAIVECERDKHGHMSPGETVSFLIDVAKSLNRNRIGGNPFGILRKAGGSNCNGYSCDIICAGNGNGQRQWDVLGDAEGAQTPEWAGPHTLPNIRVDVCEIQ